MLDNKLLDGGTIEPMVCTADLKQTIEDVIQMQRMQSDLNNIKIETKFVAITFRKLKFDQQRFCQVLTNLLSNAIKFSE